MDVFSYDMEKVKEKKSSIYIYLRWYIWLIEIRALIYEKAVVFKGYILNHITLKSIVVC